MEQKEEEEVVVKPKFELRRFFEEPPIIFCLYFYFYPYTFFFSVFLLLRLFREIEFVQNHLFELLAICFWGLPAVMFLASSWFRKHSPYMALVWILLAMFSGITQGAMSSAISKAFYYSPPR